MIWSRVKCLNQSIKRGKSSESNYSLGNQFCLQTFQRHEKNRFTFGPNIPGWYRLSITFKSERIFIRRGFIYIFRKLTAFIRVSFSIVGFSIGNYCGLAPSGIIYRLWGEGEVGHLCCITTNSPDPSLRDPRRLCSIMMIPPPHCSHFSIIPPPFQFCNSPQCKRLISASSCYKLAIVYPTSHVWFSVKVDGGWRGRGKGETNLYFPALTPLLTFDLRTPPWYKLISLPSLPLSLKLKMAAIIFVMKLLSTRSPKLRLLSRLIL